MTSASTTTFQYPRSSIDTQAYWDATRRGELLYQRCGDCDSVIFHPRVLCPYCMSDKVGWERSAGRGKVYSFTVQHVPLRRDVPTKLPLVLGIIEMDEGYHMFSEIDETDFARVVVGVPVQVYFDAVADDLSLPKFRLVASPGSQS